VPPKGIKLNYGDDFTSADIAFTIGQWIDLGIKSSMLELMGGHFNPTGIEKGDTHTVQLHLKKPEIAIPESFSHYPAYS